MKSGPSLYIRLPHLNNVDLVDQKTLTLSILYRRSCSVLPCTFAKVFILNILLFRSPWVCRNLASFFVLSLNSPHLGIDAWKDPRQPAWCPTEGLKYTIYASYQVFFLLWADEDRCSIAVLSVLRLFWTTDGSVDPDRSNHVQPCPAGPIG